MNLEWIVGSPKHPVCVNTHAVHTSPLNVFYDTIGGVEAKLVIPTGESGGITGVYFKRLDGPKLTLWGQDLTAAQQQTAIAIFQENSQSRSVRLH